MTREEKDLLFKDLCTRIPYGVRFPMKTWVDKKKNLPKNLQSAMQLLYDEGRVNITQEKIDKYVK